ncbi:MAG: hypothetical protein K6B52_00725 [Clostridiales bacterium]|nr:hypothetical protein [Clostridiales bacterium]
MFDNKCKTCGGKLNITIGSDIAVCEACGNTAAIPADEVKKYSAVFKSAEAFMRLNTVSGFENAVRQFNTISFISQAQEQISVCENRIAQLQAKQKEREKTKKVTEKRDTKTGLIIILIIAVVILFAIAGAVYCVFRFLSGNMSPNAVKIVIVTVAVFAVIIVAGRLINV